MTRMPPGPSCMQDSPYLGKCSVEFEVAGERHTLAVSYSGANEGDLLFHQQSWDPVFVGAADLAAPQDIDGMLAGRVSSLQHVECKSILHVRLRWAASRIHVAHASKLTPAELMPAALLVTIYVHDVHV